MNTIFPDNKIFRVVRPSKMGSVIPKTMVVTQVSLSCICYLLIISFLSLFDIQARINMANETTIFYFLFFFTIKNFVSYFLGKSYNSFHRIND